MSQETMTIVAVGGLKVPREDNSTRYIETTPAVVPKSSYYLRRLADGEVAEVAPAKEGNSK